MIRIAFTLIGGRDWLGGVNYLRNLIQVLCTFHANDLKPIIFVDKSISKDTLQTLMSIKGLEVVETSTLSKKFKFTTILETFIWGRNIQFHRLLKKMNIDIVFESAQFYGWRLGFPTIAWIPDFQHKVLPHLFSSFGWWRREIGFRMQILAGRFIMLSSEDARYYCEKFYPSTCGRTHVIRFAMLPKHHIIKNAGDIAKSYDLNKPFFFMPNQFWRHKNHMLVIEALKISRRYNFFPLIVSSGSQSDPRDPNYFEEFKTALYLAGLENQFRLLGLIPYDHLEGLMQQSCALINPSLFEGWSTTVEEARALGVPMILSDIGVHREQMGEDAIYFERNSATSLASALEHFVPLINEVKNARSKNEGIEAIKRANNFAIDFLNLVKHVLAVSRGRI